MNHPIESGIPCSGRYCMMRRIPLKVVLLFTLILMIFEITNADLETNIVLQNRSGIIVSPNYPQNYPHGAKIRWQISSVTPMSFLLNLTDCDIEESSTCKNDYLKVSRLFGGSTQSLRPIVCGSLASLRQQPLFWDIISYAIEVEFNTDKSVNSRGFSMTYKATYVPNEALCKSMRAGGLFRGSISTEFLGDRTRIPANLNCSWEIQIPDEGELQISVRRFTMEYFGENCLKDRFVAKTVSENGTDHIGTFCGKQNPWSFSVSNRKAIRLLFVTDFTDNKGILTLDFYQRFNPPQDTTRGPEHIFLHGKQSGKLSIPVEWLTTDEPDVTFVWHLQADPGFRINVTASIEDKESNISVKLLIYDGPNTKINDKFEYTLNNEFDSSVSRISSGFHLVLALTPEHGKLFNHINILYEVFNFFLSSDIVFRYLDVGDFTYIHNPSRIYRCCVYHALVVRYGNTIAFDLRDMGLFQTLPNDKNCSASGVVIYDGGFSPSQTIGPVCDTTENRVYDLFNNFVTSASTVYIFLYGYTNDAGRTRHQYELDPWPTTCSVQHFNEYKINQFQLGSEFAPSPDVSISHSSSFTYKINYTKSDRGCLLVYFHPWTESEPQINLQIVPKDSFSSLCQRWSLISTITDSNILSSDSSKYLEQWACSSYSNYTLEASSSKWSQRVARLMVGSIASHLCAKTPTCYSQRMWPRAPCGFIVHTASRCTWILRDSGDKKPHYWALQIIFMTPSAGQADMSCFLNVVEQIHGLKINMETRFFCVHFNSGRLRRYRTMEANSYMMISNSNSTQRFKVRFSKKRFDPKKDSLSTDFESSLCKNGSIPFQNFCYVFARSAGRISWETANKTCISDGGNLLSVTSTQELEFIKKTLSLQWNEQFFQTPLGALFIGLNDIKEASRHIWSDGNSMALTDWYRSWDKDHNILPNSPRLPLRQRLSQPVPFGNRRCVAMVIGNIYFSSNWMKIDCSELFQNPSFICKMRAPKYVYLATGNVSVPETDISENSTFTESDVLHHYNANDSVNFISPRTIQLNASVLKCPENWTMIQDNCYLLFSEDINLLEHTPESKAEQICHGLGGKLATIDRFKTRVLLSYLRLWGLDAGFGNIWIQTADGDIGCTSVTTLLQVRKGYNPDDCVLDEGRTGFVLCEMTSILITEICSSRHFMCDDGSCIHYSDVCDSQHDCRGGEDEMACSSELSNDNLLFHCGDLSTVSVSVRCDFWPDCKDSSDEHDCHHRTCSDNEFTCRNQQCIPIINRCDFETNCLDGTDEMACDWGVDDCKGFICPGGTCVPTSRVTDLITDCRDSSEEDEISEDNFRLTYYTLEEERWIKRENYGAMCPNTTLERRCHLDRKKCFNRANVCVYDKNGLGDLLYCRDGAHLVNCEDFECPQMYKCPRSYCIPWYRVCDGESDCPYGTDEQYCEQFSCPGHLLCKGTSQCIPSDQLCDGKVQCKNGWTDEQFCDIHQSKCPPTCKCKGYTIQCQGSDLRNIPGNMTKNMRTMLLQNNFITIERHLFYNFSYLHVLRLASNKISTIPKDTFLHQVNLRTLDLRNNQIDTLYANMFNGLISLLELQLEGNPLSILPGNVFLGLNSISSLNLSRLGIQTVQSEAFTGLPNLEVLDLSNNGLKTIESGFLGLTKPLNFFDVSGNKLDVTDKEVIEEIEAEILLTDSYRFCCIARPKVGECYPDSNVFSSCKDLLSTSILRAIVWFLGVSCIVGNTVVIFWRIYSGFNNRPSVYVVTLGFSDLLMGVCLVILASTDMYYRDDYILHDVEWRSGGVCKLLGILTTVSCQMSMFTLVALALDRFLTVKFPFSLPVKKVRSAWVIVVFLWLFSVLLSLVPLAFPSVFGHFYGTNSICIPLNFTDPTTQGWEYTLIVFIGLNSVCLLTIITLYVVIYCQVRESQLTVGRTDRSDLIVAKRLSIVLVTNIVSWIPVILAYVISLTVAPLSREMSTILITVILPLNPAINPYLYTFSSCSKREGRKMLPNMPVSLKTSETHL